MSPTRVVPVISSDKVTDIEGQNQHQGKHSFLGSLLRLLSGKDDDGEAYETLPEKKPKWYRKLLDAGVEENGIKPVPVEKRTSTKYTNLFTVFFTCLLNLLP